MSLRKLVLSCLLLPLSFTAIASIAVTVDRDRPPVADFNTCAKPEWPKASLAREQTGTVTLKFLVTTDGKVADAAIIKSSGHELLDQAALGGIRKCRFSPGTRNGKPEQTWTPMQYVWTLQKGNDQTLVEDIKQLREDAAKGDVEAMYNLATAYKDLGGAENATMAARLYLTAAEQKHPAATYRLAEAYRYGQGVAVNRGEAMRYHRKAAELGFAEAQNQLAWFYKNGMEGENKSPEQAAGWFKKAALQGDRHAQNTLAEMYLDGEGVQKNPVESLKWVQLAANGGSAEAQLRYGRALATGVGGDQDFQAAAVWLRKAADQRDPVAEGTLAMMYLTGHGVAVNKIEALKLLNRAAYASQPKFQVMLGYMHAKGIDTPVDRKKANALYRRAADLGDATGMNNVGYSYEMGYEVAQDYATAMTWYTKAAANGDGNAAAAIGNLYEKGLGVETNIATALKWYLDAANQKNAHGMRALANLYETGTGVQKNLATAVEWYGKSATQGDELAMRRLGTAHINGELGLPVKADLGNQWLKAAELREKAVFAPEGFRPPPVR